MAGREMAKPIEERTTEIAVPLEVEAAEALTKEEQLEEAVIATIKTPKEEEEEKRTGF